MTTTRLAFAVIAAILLGATTLSGTAGAWRNCNTTCYGNSCNTTCY